MKLSAREKYAVRAMAELATYYGQGPIGLAQVASSQRVPPRYLEHIAQQLKRAGLLSSLRGASGGYELSRPPTKITIADVFRALEGDVLPLGCGHMENCGFWEHPDECATRPIWLILRRQIEQSLEAITLDSLASTHNVNRNDLEDHHNE